MPSEGVDGGRGYGCNGLDREGSDPCGGRQLWWWWLWLSGRLRDAAVVVVLHAGDMAAGYCEAVALREQREHNWRMADEGNRGGTRVVVIVAIVGLLSTVVASLASGTLTIVAANVQFNNQRYAESQDKRREVYANYQNSVTKVCQIAGEVYGFGTPSAKEQKAGDTRINAAISEMINLNGQVQLFAHSEEMRNVADELTKRMVKDIDPICGQNEAFLESQHGLIVAAKADLEQ